MLELNSMAPMLVTMKGTRKEMMGQSSRLPEVQEDRMGKLGMAPSPLSPHSSTHYKR